MTAAAVFHPCESFDNVRYMRGHVHWAPALILPLLAVGVRFLYMHIVHYPLADVDLREVSYILEAVKILLPFCTFIIAAYAVTAIMSGEVKFKEPCVLLPIFCSRYLSALFPISYHRVFPAFTRCCVMPFGSGNSSCFLTRFV